MSIPKGPFTKSRHPKLGRDTLCQKTRADWNRNNPKIWQDRRLVGQKLALPCRRLQTMGDATIQQRRDRIQPTSWGYCSQRGRHTLNRLGPARCAIPYVTAHTEYHPPKWSWASATGATTVHGRGRDALQQICRESLAPKPSKIPVATPQPPSSPVPNRPAQAAYRFARYNKVF